VSETPISYADLVAFHLPATARTWELMREHGVDETTELRLDFIFVAADPRAAERLASFLRAETDYDVRVDRAAAPADGATWVVEGQTQSTIVSPGILEDWVAWMIAAGVDEGGCTFDGWGTHAAGA
jgi:hypothetical protein